MSWPPTLDELKLDMKIELTDTDDDDDLTTVLDAAVAFVERVRPAFNYTDSPEFVTDADGLLVDVPTPTSDLVLGTLRLAVRWHTRRRSPDGLIDMGELGAGRVPSFDPDIDRLLGIGRFAGPVFA